MTTEKMEALAESLKEIAILVKKISADKKVDLSDLVHLVAFMPKLSEVIESFKDLGGVVEEGKDLDMAEVVTLIQLVHSKLKEIEKA